MLQVICDRRRYQNENDVDTVFCLFERVADSRALVRWRWNFNVTVCLQKLNRETSSALSSGAEEDYDLVKSAVLEAYRVVL